MTARGDVKFVLDADQAKAVNGFLKIVDSQKRAERGFERTTRSARRQDSRLIAMGKTLGGLAAGFVGVGAAVQTVTSMWGAHVRGTERAASANARLEKSLRSLMALNQNALNAGSIRRDVLARSTAFAMPANEVAGARFMAESAIGNLGPDVQESVFQKSLELSQLGVNPQAAVEGAASALQSYSDVLAEVADRGEAASRMVDQLIKAADLSKATQNQLFQLAPNVMEAAGPRGFELEEALALIPRATAISGSPAEAGTRSRNLINRLSKAEEQLGIELEGSLTSQMSQVAEAIGGDMRLAEDIFEQELAGFAMNMMKGVDQIADAQRELEKVVAGESGRKLTQILANPQSRHGTFTAIGEAALQNVDAFRARDPEMRRTAMLHQAARIGLKMQDPSFDAIEDRDILRSMMAQGPGSRVVRQGLEALIEQARTAGNDQIADLLEVEFGGAFGHRAPGTRIDDEVVPGLGVAHVERGRFTGAAEADLFANLNAARAAGVEELPGPLRGFERFAEDDDRVDADEFVQGLREGGFDREGVQRMNGLLAEILDELRSQTQTGEQQNRNRPPAGVGN